jgi:predicted TIM-barrel fold metal-dependent hydrolase
MTLYGPNLTDAKRWYSCMERKYHPRRLVRMPFLVFRSQRSATSFIIGVALKFYMCRKVPNETFKAAAHLVVTGRKRKYPNVKVILAHLGGSTPFLAARVAILSRHMGCNLTPEEILEDFRSFYYETALSAYTTNLQAIDGFIPRENLLFGTDFPGM